MSFVHLHVHSEYSLLDGHSRIPVLVNRAKELGMPALALTDHGVMFGAVAFYTAAIKAGIKPIIGCEMYVAPRSRFDKEVDRDRGTQHITVLAQNLEGYRNLCKLASISQLEGFYYKPRIDREVLQQHADGLIVLSGCPSGPIIRPLREDQPDRARANLAWFRDVFPGRFFIELQDHEGFPELKGFNRELVALAREGGVPLVATNDVHYVHQADAPAQDLLLCIGTSTVMSDPKRMHMTDDSYYLKTAEEMAALFGELPDALANTLAIAEMVDFKMEMGKYHLPIFEVPEGQTAESYLRLLCDRGLAEHYPEGHPRRERAIQQLSYELGVIHQMGFDAYFLIVWDLIRFALEQNIWWNVRGSAAGSIVSYCLGLTQLDPLAHGLIFERFLNPGRVSMPDIDLDFPDDRRQEMIEYCVRKYGADRVAQIITFGTLGARAALRDVGRALDLPLPEVDRLARLVPAVPGKPVSLANVLDPEHEFHSSELLQAYNTEDYVHDLIDRAKTLEGIARHASTHAAGVVISDRPITDYAPLHRPTKGSAEGGLGAVVQYDMGNAEAIGMLKVDFLGLSTLTLLRRTCDWIKRRHGVDIELKDIPLDDPKIFELLSSGQVLGVFQVESSGMRQILTEMRPSQFDHIVAVVSLDRPGPMEYIPSFIRRMHGLERVEYRHPKLETILGETYGICVSGDALIFDPLTGPRCRLDEAGQLSDLHIQGVDDNLAPAVGRVTHWSYNGRKPVFRLTLRNGSSVNVTADHQLLTESGWRALNELHPGDYVAVPGKLLGPSNTYSRERLRVLAYLIADGSLGSLAAVNFVSKDPGLLAEYQRCLAAFPNIRPHVIELVRGVKRIGAAKASVTRYHDANSLLEWLRELGLKHPAGSKPGGCRSAEKFVPEFVFGLREEDIVFFLASLWDCDGYMGRKLCHYRTISKRLADDVQTLLLRLGIRSTIYRSQYRIDSRAPGNSSVVVRDAYQVTVFDTARLAELLRPHLLGPKRLVECTGRGAPTIDRAAFIAEVDATTTLSRRELMARYGIDHQHFLPIRLRSPRISARVVVGLAEALPLPVTRARLNVNWEEITHIEPAGLESVYDLTVEGMHNFTANGITLHNCIYQEQIIRLASELAGYSPGEADTIRKAVGKKIKEKLLEHREKFIKGAKQCSDIDEATAAAIFDDIEKFARYGFNRAHGADYAVITCQTAYLKAHYPVEYMAALMSIERGNTEKLGAIVAEARRLGIQVLPPSVNESDADFCIDDLPSGPVIRFGLTAVKNVGEGPVHTILNVRGQGGPFRDLEDFARRVDLRQVNRRALESLIKVDAFSAFGTRAQLLAAVDRVMGFSTAEHRAADIGQMTLFGDSPGGGTLGKLPAVADTPRKEQIEWEKDLVGTYLGEHPLQAMIDKLGSVVTAHAYELDENMKDRQVTLAGMVTSVRTLITKKGDPMAFVMLEDLTGVVEVTVFPRLWASAQALFVVDKLLIVTGKVDAQGKTPKIIADRATDKFTQVRSADRPDELPPPRSRLPAGRPGAGSRQQGTKQAPPTPARPAAPPALPISEPPPFDDTGGDWETGEMLAPPEEPPVWWDGPATVISEPPAPAVDTRAQAMKGQSPVSSGQSSVASGRSPLPGAGPAPAAASQPAAGASQLPASNGPEAAAMRAPAQSAPSAAPVTTAHARPATDFSPLATSLTSEANDSSPRLIEVRIKRSGNLEYDKSRVRTVHELLLRYPGHDRFRLVLAGARSVQLDFPNDTTGYCAALEQQLGEMLGAGSLVLLAE